jgi:hypothetical protein
MITGSIKGSVTLPPLGVGRIIGKKGGTGDGGAGGGAGVGGGVVQGGGGVTDGAMKIGCAMAICPKAKVIASTATLILILTNI